MLELLSQKEQIIAQAVDGMTIDQANSGSIANSLMQSFIRAPNLSDSIEEYVPDKPDEDMTEIEDEIIQGVMSDAGYGEISNFVNSSEAKYFVFHIGQFPSGRWGYFGFYPASLQKPDSSSSLSFDTREEAVAVAKKEGFEHGSTVFARNWRIS